MCLLSNPSLSIFCFFLPICSILMAKVMLRGRVFLSPLPLTSLNYNFSSLFRFNPSDFETSIRCRKYKRKCWKLPLISILILLKDCKIQKLFLFRKWIPVPCLWERWESCGSWEARRGGGDKEVSLSLFAKSFHFPQGAIWWSPSSGRRDWASWSELIPASWSPQSRSSLQEPLTSEPRFLININVINVMTTNCVPFQHLAIVVLFVNWKIMDAVTFDAAILKERFGIGTASFPY